MNQYQRIAAQHSGVRMLLRNATHRSHIALNRHPMLQGLTTPNYPIEKYRRLLLAYFHIYGALEQKITTFLGHQTQPFSYADRQKLPWLMADLCYFSLEKSALCKPSATLVLPPKIETLGQLIGVLYVVEGSTLGGQIIARSLDEFAHLTPGQGATFFAGYGAATLSYWGKFIHFAEAIHANDAERRVAASTACSTFQLFARTLDHYATDRATFTHI